MTLVVADPYFRRGVLLVSAAVPSLDRLMITFRRMVRSRHTPYPLQTSIQPFTTFPTNPFWRWLLRLLLHKIITDHHVLRLRRLRAIFSLIESVFSNMLVPFRLRIKDSRSSVSGGAVGIDRL